MWNFWKKEQEQVSFEDVQFAIQHITDFIIINTLPENEQNCLIKNTVQSFNEENIINELMQHYNYRNPKFIIYGRNTCDNTASIKCKQLLNYGFVHVYIYVGGLFEWLTLQDIYGKEEFPTTTYTLDILKYKPHRKFGGILLT